MSTLLRPPRMERALDRSPVDREFVAEMVRTAVAMVPHPMAISDYETVLFANSHALELVGADSPEEFVGQPISKFIHPDMSAAAAARKAVVIERRQALRDVPTKYFTLAGEELCGLSQIIPIEYEDRHCVLWVYRTVALHSAPHGGPSSHPCKDGQCAAVFEALPGPMLLHDESTILAANAACRGLLGAAPDDDLVGLAVEAIVHADGQSAGRTRRGMATSSGVARFEAIPVKLVRLDGRTMHCKVDAHLISARGRRAFLVTTTMGAE